MRVLLVDDDPDICTLACAHIRSWGHEVASVTDAEQAEKLVARGGVEVAIVDVGLGEDNGFDLCQTLVGAGIPVVMLTANGSLDTAVEALRDGAADFVTKPIDWEALAQALERAAQRRAGAPVNLNALERHHILEVLGAVRGNKSEAARLLGMDRRTLYRKLDRYRTA